MHDVQGPRKGPDSSASPLRREPPRPGEASWRAGALPGSPVAGRSILLRIQRECGNRFVTGLLERQAAEGEAEEELPPPEPVQSVTGQGEEHEVVVEGNGGRSISLHGETSASYNGGAYSTSNETVTRGQGCAGCPPEQCIHVSGTLTTVYSVATTIDMPGMPDGLTPCQQERVQHFLDNVLRPHEEEHVARFEQYNGTTERQFAFTTCREAFPDRIAAMVAAEEGPRRRSAQQASDDLDPFNRRVDLDCEEEEEPSAP